MAELPLVTIAMPCLNEERFIAACLDSVRAQDYPADRIEILVAHGRSTDRTAAIIAGISASDPRVRLVDNPESLQAAGMNHVIRQARGDVIVRMDVHAEYAPDYVRRCVEALEKTGADNVGGAQRARAVTAFQRALCAALASPLGVGGARYRSADAEGFVDTVFLGAFRRRVFETVGMYDPRAITNEDAELNQRILAAGGRVYLSRDIVVHYHPRETFTALARQYFRYGRGRARTLLKHGEVLRVRPLIPATMVAGGAMLALTPLGPVAAGAYAALCSVEAVRKGVAEGLGQIPMVFAMFPVMHVAHGAGFWAGLLRYLRAPDWSAAPDKLGSR
jgi:cellulose synthase/poly-beta-1,6-N-acetylglucosamine synthase-like glycosyltransferase